MWAGLQVILRDLDFKDDDPKDNEDNYDYMIMMMMVIGVDDFSWGCSGQWVEQ